jgi:hypothetical protein
MFGRLLYYYIPARSGVLLMSRVNRNPGTLHSLQVVIYESCMISKVLQKLSSGLISRPNLPMASAGLVWSTPCPGRLVFCILYTIFHNLSQSHVETTSPALMQHSTVNKNVSVRCCRSVGSRPASASATHAAPPLDIMPTNLAKWLDE